MQIQPFRELDKLTGDVTRYSVSYVVDSPMAQSFFTVWYGMVWYGMVYT
jgi:hypothetical protein